MTGINKGSYAQITQEGIIINKGSYAQTPNNNNNNNSIEQNHVLRRGIGICIGICENHTAYKRV